MIHSDCFVVVGLAPCKTTYTVTYNFFFLIGGEHDQQTRHTTVWYSRKGILHWVNEERRAADLREAGVGSLGGACVLTAPLITIGGLRSQCCCF